MSLSDAGLDLDDLLAAYDIPDVTKLTSDVVGATTADRSSPWDTSPLPALQSESETKKTQPYEELPSEQYLENGQPDFNMASGERGNSGTPRGLSPSAGVLLTEDRDTATKEMRFGQTEGTPRPGYKLPFKQTGSVLDRPEYQHWKLPRTHPYRRPVTVAAESSDLSGFIPPIQGPRPDKVYGPSITSSALVNSGHLVKPQLDPSLAPAQNPPPRTLVPPTLPLIAPAPPRSMFNRPLVRYVGPCQPMTRLVAARGPSLYVPPPQYVPPHVTHQAPVQQTQHQSGIIYPAVYILPITSQSVTSSATAPPQIIGLSPLTAVTGSRASVKQQGLPKPPASTQPVQEVGSRSKREGRTPAPPIESTSPLPANLVKKISASTRFTKPITRPESSNALGKVVSAGFKIPAVETKLTARQLAHLDPIGGPNPIPRYRPDVPPPGLGVQLSDQPFACVGCQDAFIFESSLKNHLARQSVRLTFSCQACDGATLSFSNKCALKRHIKDHKESGLESPSIGANVGINILRGQPPHAILPQAKSEFQCRICQHSTEDARSLKTHYGTNKRGIKCNICHIVLPNNCSYMAHCTLHGYIGGSEWTCPECGLSFNQKDTNRTNKNHNEKMLLQFLHHLNRVCHHFNRWTFIKCDKCCVKVRDWHMFWSHYISKHSETYYKCQGCPMAFKSEESFRAHKVTTHDTPGQNDSHVNVKTIHKCPLCNTVFNDYHLLLSHANESHTKDLSAKVWPKFEGSGYTCFLCHGFYSEFVNQLESHLILHPPPEKGSKSQKIVCRFCKQSVPEDSFERHLVTKHLICYDFVKKSTVQKTHGLMITETAAHSNKSPATLAQQTLLPTQTLLPAQALLTETSGSSELKTMPLANNGPPMQKIAPKPLPEKLEEQQELGMTCPSCQKKCSTRKNLASHVRSHERDGQYVCCICAQRVFDSREALMRHRKLCWKDTGIAPVKQMPTVERRQVCSYCSERFTSKEDLNDHLMEAHGLAKLFPCHLCGLTYMNNHGLRRHIQIIHEGKRKVYTCWLCLNEGITKTFSKRILLQKHITLIHRIPPNRIDFHKMPKTFASFINEEPPDEVKDTDVIMEDSGKRKTEDGSDSESSEATPVKRLKLDGEDQFTCAKCDFVTSSKDVFQAHIAGHKGSGDSLQCPECGMCFVVLTSLKRHLFIVHKIKRIDKYCMDNTLVEVAPLSHDAPLEESWKRTDASTFECNVCGKRLESEALVKRHMRTHGVVFLRSKRATQPSNKPTPDKPNPDDSNRSEPSAQESDGVTQPSNKPTLDKPNPDDSNRSEPSAQESDGVTQPSNKPTLDKPNPDYSNRSEPSAQDGGTQPSNRPTSEKPNPDDSNRSEPSAQESDGVTQPSNKPTLDEPNPDYSNRSEPSAQGGGTQPSNRPTSEKPNPDDSNRSEPSAQESDGVTQPSNKPTSDKPNPDDSNRSEPSAQDGGTQPSNRPTSEKPNPDDSNRSEPSAQDGGTQPSRKLTSGNSNEDDSRKPEPSTQEIDGAKQFIPSEPPTEVQTSQVEGQVSEIN